MAARHAAAALCFALLSGQAEAQKWRPVKGESVRSLFGGKELGDGVHFSYRFLAEGTFTGTEMGKDVRGRWRVTGSEMCWKWLHPPSAEECYAVQVDGAEIRLMRNGYEAWNGTLRP